MPSTIGHALAGATVAWAAEAITGFGDARRGQTCTGPAPDPGSDPHLTPGQRVRLHLTAVCAILAAAPDIDLLFPVTHRTYSHSIGATLLVAVFSAAMAANARLPMLRVASTCTAAYGSHLLLDWLAVDFTPPLGLQLLWPINGEWYISGLDVFRGTARRNVFSE